MIHSLLKLVIKTQRIHKFVFLNAPPTVKGNCIYAVNHSCKWDFQYMVELAPKHFYVLAGKQRLKFIDRIAFIWNGVVWVDRKNKKSKSNSKEKMHALAKKGRSLCIFPEGTWNLSPSAPVLPIYWGVIDVAKSTETPIVPVCLEYRDKCYVKYGEPITLDKDADKLEAIQQLRDIFATLKWDIWESFPCEKRADIDDNYWNEEVSRRLKEYTLLDYEYEMSCIRQQSNK